MSELFSKPIFSILMPAYQAEKFISSAINSVLNQTFPNWEIIIVDDCSNDNTLQIALNYANRDTRIKVFKNEKNLGQAQNWNEAMRYATGDRLGFLPCDDLYHHQTLEKIEQAIQKTGSDIQIYAHYAFHEATEKKDLVRPFNCEKTGKLQDLARIFYEKGNIFGEVSCYFVKRSLFTDTGIRFGENCSTLDLETWTNLCLESPGSIYYYTPECLATTTIHPAADSSNYRSSGKNWLDFFRFHAKFSHVSWPLKTRLRQVPRLIFCFLRQRKVIPKSDRARALSWLLHALINLTFFRNHQILD